MNEGTPKTKPKDRGIVPITDARRDELRDPDLLQCQIDFKTLAEELLAFKPSNRVTCVNFWDIQADPKEILERIRSTSLGNVLLPLGASLSAPHASEYQPELGLYANDEDLTGVSITAYGWEYEKYRLDPKGPERSPFNVISFPNEYDWVKEIVIGFQYGKKRTMDQAQQKLSSQTGSLSAGILPNLTRDVSASAYAEQGYDGHNQIHREFSNEVEVTSFLDLARELFQRRNPAK